jgi:hypothetical protein
VDDDWLLSSLRRIAEPVEPRVDFLDRLYETLASELGFSGEPAMDSVHWLGGRSRPRPQPMRVSLWLRRPSCSPWPSSAAWPSSVPCSNTARR